MFAARSARADALPGVPGPRIVAALNIALRGDTDAGLVAAGTILATVGEFPADGSVQAAIQRNSFNGLLPKATVNLNIDPNDGDNPDYANASANNPIIGSDDFEGTVNFYYDPAGIVQGSLSGHLTDWQEALLGCGPFYQRAATSTASTS